FDESAADPQKAREYAGGGARPKPGTRAVDTVAVHALIFLVEVHAAQAEALHERAFLLSAAVCAVLRGLRDAHHRRGGIQDDDPARPARKPAMANRRSSSSRGRTSTAAMRAG